MITFVAAATEAARLAGEVLMNRSGMTKIEYKDSARKNLVSNIDREAEKTIVSYLSEHWPDHQILGEEGGENRKNSPYKWIIDPLDGTTNYVHGFPFFSISIGLEYKGVIQAGVVFEPARNHLFSAEKGSGARMNGETLSVSKVRRLSEALLVTGFSYQARTDQKENFENFYHFSRAAQAVRRTGSAALDLCYLASGFFDGYWELNLSPWDTAAGSLIVEEAGGRITTFDGNPYSIYAKEILASNGQIHGEMIEVLQKKSQALP